MLATVRLGAVHSVVFGGMFCFHFFTVPWVSKQLYWYKTKKFVNVRLLYSSLNAIKLIK
jgi:hypothetical protein